MALFNTPDYAHIIWAPQQWPEGESGVTGLMSGLSAGMGGGGGGGFAGLMGGGGKGGGGATPRPMLAPAATPYPEQKPAMSTAHWGSVGVPSTIANAYNTRPGQGDGMAEAINNLINQMLSQLR